MIEAQMVKTVQVIAPTAIKDNASWTTVEIDTLGFDYLVIKFMLGANDIAVAALKVQESDTSGSGQTDIDGGDFSVDSTLPSATEDNGIFSFYMDLRKLKRFITLVATNGDGSVGGYACAWADLSRAEQAPSTASQRGNTRELFV